MAQLLLAFIGGWLTNVRAAAKRLGITYPVVIDGDHAIWNAWMNP